MCVCAYREVVSEELHDERAVFVRVLGQLIQLCDGVVESLNIKMIINKRPPHISTFSSGLEKRKELRAPAEDGFL